MMTAVLWRLVSAEGTQNFSTRLSSQPASASSSWGLVRVILTPLNLVIEVGMGLHIGGVHGAAETFAHVLHDHLTVNSVAEWPGARARR